MAPQLVTVLPTGAWQTTFPGMAFLGARAVSASIVFPDPESVKGVGVVLSGGMDSTVLAYLCNKWFPGNVHAISFNYGQRHAVELYAAHRTAVALHIPHTIVDLSTLSTLLVSSLTPASGGTEVPEGLYDADNMRQTVVPNRNMIMMAVAAGIISSQGGNLIMTAVHAGDHAVYPDCRAEFIDALDKAMVLGTDVRVLAPFNSLSKAQIVTIGHRLGVNWADTWSCYKGGDVHCGRCGTCTERIEAFYNAGVTDAVEYDPDGHAYAMDALAAAGKIV